MTPSLTAATDRDPLSYGVGDPIRFEFAVSGAPRDSRIRWRRTGDDGVVEEGEEPGGGGQAAIIAKGLSRPGFMRVDADLVSPGGATLASFSGGAGVDVAAIRADTPEPPDFDAFWARRNEALAALPARGATCREIASPRADVRLFCVEIPCPGGHPSTGILSVPSSGGPFPAKLRLRGYEASWSEIARTTPQPEELSAAEIVFFLSAHGFEFNREPEYYAKFRAESGSGGWDVAFDPVQNSDPGESYFGGIAWRVLRGLEWLETRPEWDGQSLVVFGGSLGGWQSIVAAAFDRNVTECRPRIPWCCNMAGPAAGRAHGDWFVPWVPALAYYDPVNMARRIPAACRVVVPQAGLGDAISPPFGIMAFYNALRCPKEALFVQGAGHFSFPERPRQASFLRSPEAGHLAAGAAAARLRS